MKHRVNGRFWKTLSSAAPPALAVALSACASLPATVPTAQRSEIKRVGVVSLVENEMHAYFKVGPVLREKVGASIRETFLGPPVLGRWRVNHRLVTAASKALGHRYRYVPLHYDPAKLARKAYKADPEHLKLGPIKHDLRRIGEGDVDTIVLVSTSGSLTRVVGRKVFLSGYGVYRQSILPGAPTVDYVALRLMAIDVKTMQPVATRSAFVTRRLPTAMWNINVTSITPQQRLALRKHVGNLLKRTVTDLVQDIGLGRTRPD